MLKQSVKLLGFALAASLLGFLPFVLLARSRALPSTEQATRSSPIVTQTNLTEPESASTTSPPLDPQVAASEIRLEISLNKRTVSLYQANTLLKTYPIAVGREGWETPKGSFHVNQMLQNPAWIHPFTNELIPTGDPRNPLGNYWIGFWTDGHNSIGFHGTPETDSIGSAASHGCIRMYSRDVEELFHIVKISTLVTVVP